MSSESRALVVRIGPIRKHENADTLSITDVFGGYPCIIRTGEYQEGDLAAYIPVDLVVPAGSERFAFLGDQRRIKARRLRGIFSMGLLTPVEDGWEEGDDVTELLGLTKYEAPVAGVSLGGQDNEHDPIGISCYTDIEGWRKWKSVLQDGEEVILTEKIHGANARYLWSMDRLWCGSRTGIKKQDERSIWWRAAAAGGLEERLQQAPGIVLFGEVYGSVQDLKYGLAGQVRFVAFDAMELATRRYLDYDEFEGLCAVLEVPIAPVLYRGPWYAGLTELAEGKTVLGNGACIREGFVVKPVKERWHPGLDRVILKVVGEGYHLRKGG